MGESSATLGLGALIAGRYRIERALSRGGMGAVFVARHEQTGRRFAVKLMAQDLAGAEEAEARFTREARLASSLDHPAIIEVYDVGQHEGHPYMVMRLLEGESLGARIKRGRVPPQEAVALLAPALEGLVIAHARAIVHRDLKPDNIYLSAEDGRIQPKILDFGISKLVGNEATQKLTRTGVALGTPLYMSPEQVRGEKDLDSRTDIYSLGVILYEMLTGKTPYHGENYANLVLEIISGGAPGIRTHDPSLPEALEHVVACAIAVNRDERYPDVGSMLADLRAIAVGAAPNLTPRFSIETTPGSRTPFATESKIASVSRRPSRTLPTSALAAVGGALLVGLGAWAAWPAPPSEPEPPVHAAALPPTVVAPTPPPAGPPEPAAPREPAPTRAPLVAPTAQASSEKPDGGVATEPTPVVKTSTAPATPAPAAPAAKKKPARVVAPVPAPQPPSSSPPPKQQKWPSRAPRPEDELIDPFR